MLKGLAITPPVIGRISIGKVVEKNGRRLPEKDDEFTLTSQVQGKEGWLPHPLDAQLRKESEGKLRSIPVRLLFNDPALSLRASYSLFDRSTGRPLCVGNGESCKRVTAQGVEQLPCPAPEGCDLGANGNCKPYARLNVRVDAGQGDEDELGSFVFRTTGFNSIRTLTARLKYFHGVSGGLLAALPLALRLRGKSSSNLYRSTLYYVDLTTRAGSNLHEAIAEAVQLDEQRKQLGFDQHLLDEAAREGFAQGAFEEDAEEGVAVLEEFYPDSAATDANSGTEATPSAGIGAKLQQRVHRVRGNESPTEARG